MLEAARRTASMVQYLAGRPVAATRTGLTPHQVIFRQNKASLRFFAPVGPASAAPVLIVMPLINDWTIFDLIPGRSVVERLVQAGIPVYLLDWGVPTKEDAALTVSDLIDGLLYRVMDRARRHAATQYGAEALDAVGYCVGGTFLAVYLARNPDAVRRVAFVATPIDFYKAGKLADQVKPELFPLDRLVNATGNYPGPLIKGGFVMLKPTNETAKYMSLWERGDDASFRELWAAVEAWNNNSIDFPGEAYREYVRACYFDNRLMRGDWNLAGTAVRLSEARAPALVLAASKDHIVPPDSAFALAEVWGAKVETKLLKGGHVGICVAAALPDALISWAKAE